jgi:hypothetical protein
MLLSLDTIRSEMVAAKEAVGADVTDGALVEEHFEALSFNMDRLYNAAFDGDSGETLSDP